MSEAGSESPVKPAVCTQATEGQAAMCSTRHCTRSLPSTAPASPNLHYLDSCSPGSLHLLDTASSRHLYAAPSLDLLSMPVHTCALPPQAYMLPPHATQWQCSGNGNAPHRTRPVPALKRPPDPTCPPIYPKQRDRACATARVPARCN